MMLKKANDSESVIKEKSRLFKKGGQISRTLNKFGNMRRKSRNEAVAHKAA